MQLIPTYNRDYRSAEEVQKDLDGGKDFVIADCSSPWNGKACNNEDLIRKGYTEVNIRYNKLRSVGIFEVIR